MTETASQPLLRLLILLLPALLFQGCSTAPTSRGPQISAEVNDAILQAQSLREQGRNGEAATLYERIAAQTPPPSRWRYLFLAAESAYAADQPEETERLLQGLEGHPLPPDLSLRRRLLAARLALGNKRGEEALKRLGPPPGEETPAAERLAYHRLRAEALRLSGNLLDSARELAAIDPLLADDPEARLANQNAILQTLNGLSEQVLETFQNPPPDPFSGWLDLALIGKRNIQTPAALEQALAQWRERFPGHPALPELLDLYRQRTASQFIELNTLAVMLPESGPYARAAAALRDGLMAAYYNAPLEERPQLRFYDSSNPEQAWPLLQQAAEEGANVVIGPLAKDAVRQLLHAGELPLPVLALNRVPLDTTPPADLYQFALAPEDEAVQIADKAWSDGRSTALVFTPQGNWGDRVRQSFEERWRTLGGELAAASTYDPAQSDFSVPIRRLLLLDQSRARFRRLRNLLGRRIAFEPRRRQDAELIVLAARAQKAREIWPQLQFFRAGDLPTYTTSKVYEGEPDPQRDVDLEGLMFPDIPWILEQKEDGPLSRAALKPLYPGVAGPYARLYAMGIDAYHLLPQLLRLRSSPVEVFPGATGRLYLDEARRVHRQLLWARFRKGVPDLLGYTPQIDTAPQDGTPGEAPLPAEAPSVPAPGVR